MTTSPEAEQIFLQTFARSAARFGMITSMRRIARAGLAHGLEVIAREDSRFLHRMATAPDMAGVMTDPEAFIARGGPDAIGRVMAEQTAASAAFATDAASVVFAHATVDDAALQCCRITALLAPDEWAENLTDRKVSLADVRKTTYAELRDKAIARRLDELAKDSILKKTDTIFARCRPPAGWSPFTDGVPFSRDRLARLDRLRHDIVHTPSMDVEMGDVDEELWFLLRLPFAFLWLINARYGVRLAWEKLQAALARHGPQRTSEPS